jgi:hypothetical protein
MTRRGKIAWLPAAILLGINEGYDGSQNPELTRPPNPSQSELIQVNPT